MNKEELQKALQEIADDLTEKLHKLTLEAAKTDMSTYEVTSSFAVFTNAVAVPLLSIVVAGVKNKHRNEALKKLLGDIGNDVCMEVKSKEALSNKLREDMKEAMKETMKEAMEEDNEKL